MENRRESVFGIYQSREKLEMAIDILKEAGFSSSDVSVMFSSPGAEGEIAHKNSTKAPEAAITGILSGATVGGVLGWLAGMGTLALTGVGPLIAAGPIMAALAGASVGGAVGGVGGALVGLGMPEYEAQRYANRINNGGILIAIHADTADDVSDARRILRETDAEDISAQPEIEGREWMSPKDSTHPHMKHVV